VKAGCTVRRIYSTLSAWFVTLALLLSSLPASTARADGVTVTNPDGHLGAVEAFRTNQTTLAYDAGVKWERLTFWWRGMQNKPGEALNPFYLPLSYVDQERAHGIEVVGLLVNTPDWAAADPSQGGKSPPKNLNLPYNDPNNYWGQYVRSVVKMYAGHIDTWVIWNEPDITPDAPNAQYYIWSGTPGDYAQLLKVAYLNAHEVNPNVKIANAAVTYWTDIHLGREQWFNRFLTALTSDPTAAQHNQYFDICTVNLYTNPEGLYTVPTLYHQMMKEKGFDKPIWVTETNVVPYNDPVNKGTPNETPTQMRSTLDEQANYILQAMAMGLAAGVQKISVYKMKDGDGDVINGEALVYENGTKRPAYYAFQVAAQYFANYKSATLFAPGDLREVVFDKGSERVTVLWDAAPTAISVQVNASGGQAKKGGPTGNFQPISASNGIYSFDLPGATMHTDLDNPSVYQVGGTPIVLVETGVSGAVQSAKNLSPVTMPNFKTTAARVAGVPPSGPLPGEADAPTPVVASSHGNDPDYNTAGGHFFTQANGAGGKGGSGYSIVDDGNARFWTAFNQGGGVNVLGYPSSRRYQLDGFTYQATQRVVLQWQPDGVHYANVFDQLSAAGKDDELLAFRQIPKSQDWSSDTGKSFPDVIANHVAILDAVPAIKAAYLADPGYLDHFGLPMAVSDQGGVIVMRGQRAVFQLWKQDVPWAKAGQVTVALGGDIAKDAKLVPAAAQQPEPIQP